MADLQAPVRYATIPLSGQVSDPITITGVRTLGVWIPVVTSGELRLLASFDQTSANFVPVYNAHATPVASRWYANTGPGSVAVALDVGAVAPFPFIKLETSVPQAAARSLAVTCKFS